jgi:hypothetical protein
LIEGLVDAWASMFIIVIGIVAYARGFVEITRWFLGQLLGQ